MRKEQDIIFMLNNSSKVVGTKQVLRGMASDELRCVILSEDAEDFIKTKVRTQAEKSGVEVIVAPSMAWLGKECNIAVNAAAVGIIKD
ncbi:MAG: ribosomal L7Ae/L30e/S12e/Gadd45 family protein [Christensenellales bacterium]